MTLQTEPFVKQKFCILTININKTTMKTRLLLCFLLLTTSALWAQSDKRKQPSEQIKQLYERYKQNQTLSKEEYNLLSPHLAEMPADLSEKYQPKAAPSAQAAHRKRTSLPQPITSRKLQAPTLPSQAAPC